MSDARQSPIPQDRVNENIDQHDRAQASKAEQKQQERFVSDQGVVQRPGADAEGQPGIPDEPLSPAEGGD